MRACFSGDYVSDQTYTDSTYTFDALHDAACNGDAQQAETLLQSGTDINVSDTDGNTPLFWAVSGCSSADNIYQITDGHRAVTTLLINNGASVNITNAYGETPLHWASAWGTSDIAMSLISQGANINAVDTYQSTPLHWAAHWGNASSAEALVNVGVPLNPKDLDGNTPLDVARYYDEAGTIQTLLQSRGALASTTSQ